MTHGFEELPDILVVCDHGIRGGHLDVVRYVWPPRGLPGVAHWAVPVPGPSGEVRQTQLAGDRPGVTSFFTADLDLPRLHHEIVCTTQHCMSRAYRSDVKRLQTLLRTLGGHAGAAEVVTITLEALHSARDIGQKLRAARLGRC